MTASATRFETLPQNPTPLEKRNAYAMVLNGLMKDLGDKLSAGINWHPEFYHHGAGGDRRQSRFRADALTLYLSRAVTA